MAIALKKFQKCFADFVAGQCSRPFSEDLGTEFRKHYRIISKRDSQHHAQGPVDFSVPGIVLGFRTGARHPARGGASGCRAPTTAEAGRLLCVVLSPYLVRELADILFGEGAQFGADYIGRKPGTEQASIHGGKPALVECFARAGLDSTRDNLPEPVLEPFAYQCPFVRFAKEFSKRGLDVAVADTPRTGVAGDAVTTPMTGACIIPRQFSRVADLREELFVLLLAGDAHALC